VATDAYPRTFSRATRVHVYSEVLDDDDILLEPSCFAWALQGLPPRSEAGGGRGGDDSSSGDAGRRGGGVGDGSCGGGDGARGGVRGEEVRGERTIGSNFSLPHRDYSAEEAWTTGGGGGDDGRWGDPNLLCVWMPVTDATLDTGCLYMVPRGADKCWGDPAHPVGLHRTPP